MHVVGIRVRAADFSEVHSGTTRTQKRRSRRRRENVCLNCSSGFQRGAIEHTKRTRRVDSLVGTARCPLVMYNSFGSPPKAFACRALGGNLGSKFRATKRKCKTACQKFRRLLQVSCLFRSALLRNVGCGIVPCSVDSRGPMCLRIKL